MVENVSTSLLDLLTASANSSNHKNSVPLLIIATGNTESFPITSRAVFAITAPGQNGPPQASTQIRGVVITELYYIA